MAVYERSAIIEAPLPEVWAFHATVDGLIALTPEWMGLEIIDISGPNGATDSDELVEGTRIDMAVRPFGILPASTWTAEIVTREYGPNEALFRDEMVRGPFDRWRHTHRFSSIDGHTRLLDHVEYALPLCPLRHRSGPLWPMLEGLFRYRHQRTKELLEERG